METWVYSLSGKHIIFNFVAKGWGYSLAYTTEDILPFRMEPNLERRNLAFGEIFRTRTDLDVRFAAAYAEGDKETEFKRILREQVTEQKKIPISVSRQFENISELNFFFKPALFENSRNEPVLISAYGFRENDIKFGKSVDGTEQAINIRTVARDRDLRDLSLTEHSVPVKPAGFDESGELISLKQIPIRTNYFYLIATVDNPVGKQKGFKDYTIKFPVYKDRQLHLSSVIFAKDISPVERQRKSSVVSPFVRHNLVIRMDPFTELRASQPVYLYFEIYDLQKNKDGKTEYGIEYTVTPVKKTGVLHFIAGLNPFKKSGGKISISYDQEGRENNDYFSVRLDLSQLVPGPYIMNVRVKDKTANVAKETKTDFVLQ
ncbi:MAG TPA: hypothetical protein ENG82_01350 [Bacteroidetes bacterium]|nr:hypothetical protein [Bacteroidota bacterium]